MPVSSSLLLLLLLLLLLPFAGAHLTDAEEFGFAQLKTCTGDKQDLITNVTVLPRNGFVLIPKMNSGA